MLEMPKIAGLDALSEKFGPWPAFHDTEILRSGSSEDRIKVGIHSVFGAGCTFTCSQGRVLRIEKTGV